MNIESELKKKKSLPEGWVLQSECLCAPPTPLPPNLYVEILTPKDDGIRRWGLWSD